MSPWAKTPQADIVHAGDSVPFDIVPQTRAACGRREKPMIILSWWLPAPFGPKPKPHSSSQIEVVHSHKRAEAFGQSLDLDHDARCGKLGFA